MFGRDNGRVETYGPSDFPVTVPLRANEGIA